MSGICRGGVWSVLGAGAALGRPPAEWFSEHGLLGMGRGREEGGGICVVFGLIPEGVWIMRGVIE